MLNFYDKEILKLQNIFSGSVPSDYSAKKSWPILENEELILKSDMAIDLGGGEAYGISGILFTTHEQLVPENRIFVSGPSIKNLVQSETEKDINYSRFVVIRLKKSAVEDKTPQQLYGIFRKLDYVRYHIFPDGFALRMSAVQHRETVRISKTAVQKEIDFERIGFSFIKTYLNLPEVETVQLYFLSSLDKTENFKQLDSISRKANEITESLNEIFKGLKMDCSICSQKNLCDEIEGLKELHFAAEKTSS